MGILDTVLRYKEQKDAQARADIDAIPQAIAQFQAGRQQATDNLLKSLTLQATLAQSGLKLNQQGNSYSISQDPNSIYSQKSLLDQQLKQSQINLNNQKATSGLYNNTGVGDTTLPVETPEGKQAYLQTLPESIRPIVSQLVKGQMRIGDLQRIPAEQKKAILNASAYLGLDTNKMETRYKTRKDFAAGGKVGVGINAANTVLGHLGTLSDQLEALNNTSFTPANAAINYTKNKFGAGEVTSAKSAVSAVGSEMMKVYRQTGAGSVQEIEDWVNNFPINGSKEQQKASIDTAVKLLGSKTNTWDQQWKDAFDSPMENNIFTSEAQKVLKRFGHEDLIGSSGVSSNPEIAVGTVKPIKGGGTAKWDGKGWVKQ